MSEHEKPAILIVDDDRLVLDSVRDVLLNEGTYAVTATCSPQEAVELLDAQTFHVMMTDLMMDELSGMELIRAARQRQPGLVSVVMTAYGSKEVAITAVKEGAYDFLEKPLTPAIITQTVERAWRTRRAELEQQRLHDDLRRTNRQLLAEAAERRRVEMELVQTQKLDAVGQLASGIAHEINTPMQFIGDNLHFLQENFTLLQEAAEAFQDQLPRIKAAVGSRQGERLERLTEEVCSDYIREEIPRAIEESLVGVSRLAGIVRAMRDFSHPGTGEWTDTDINEAVRSMVTVSRSEWKYVAELELILDEGLPPVPCLPGEINQALLNLILNAAQAVSEVAAEGAAKGRITVTTARQDADCLVSVTDSGSGISPAIQGKIFDPFFTTKQVGKGTGQGLAITRSIVVNKHDGKIWFESGEGQTSFFVLLPLGEAGPKSEGGDP